MSHSQNTLPTGVLASQQIEALVASGAIAAPALVPGQVQPASLDLRLGSVAYRVRASFLPGAGRTLEDRLAEFEMHRIDLTQGAVLEKGAVYLVPLQERVALPVGVSAVANAKSSTGRLDLLTRTVTDGGTEFDRIPGGYNGPLYAEICPRSFSVLVRPGMRLNQIRFRVGEAMLSDDALRNLHAASPLVDGTPVIDDGLGFSVDLTPGPQNLVGWRAKPHTGVIDLDRLGHYSPDDFWEAIRTDQRRIILDPGAFYILVSREAVSIPPTHAAEWRPIWPWWVNSGCITRAFSTQASGMARPRAACWKFAATKRLSFWKTGRSSGGWSMRPCPRLRHSYTDKVSRRIIRVRV